MNNPTMSFFGCGDDCDCPCNEEDAEETPMALAGAGGEVVAGAAGLAAVAIGAIAGIGALIGLGVAAAVSGNEKPAYGKGAAIGAGAGLLSVFVF